MREEAFMKIRTVFVLFCLLSYAGAVYAAEKASVAKLPPPRTDKGKPLMLALKERASSRNFSQRELPLAVLSDLLWAACGVNRPEKGGRTAPSAHNMQEIDIYVAKADGLYRYNASDHTLEHVLSEDIRAATGVQRFVAQAPVNLVYVADYARMGKVGKEKDFYSATDTGFISQNVYLFCASEGLATVVRGWFEAEKLHAAMKLKPSQKIILTQTVGYPQ